jgi:FG-GAP-like repeat
MTLKVKIAMLLAIGLLSGCCFAPVSEPIVSPTTDAGGRDGGTRPDSGLPTPTQCLINGTTYSDGALNPANPCQSCQIAEAVSFWTGLPDGEACGGGRTCVSGACIIPCIIDGGYVPVGGTDPTGCLSCTREGLWTPARDGTPCTLGPTTTIPLFCSSGVCGPGCTIGGTYYGAGEKNPRNSCQDCEIPSGTTWTNLQPGTSCAGGGVCDLTGNCGPMVCTFPTPTGAFVQFPNGASNPDDPSLCCNTSLKILTWAPRLVLSQTLDVPGDLSELASGDFDRDGWPDLAVITGGPSNVTLTTFMNQHGVLRPAFAYAISAGSVAITAADLNNDARADLILADTVVGTVTVWMGNGDGSFNQSITYPAGPAGHGSLQAADFNGDGFPDLISGFGPIDYFQGFGDGGLSLTQTFNDQAIFQQRFAVGDLNGDRTPDIAVSMMTGSTGQVTAIYGNGSGGFRWSASWVNVDLSPNTLTDLLEGDFDSDGFRDLALATFGGSNSTPTLGFIPGFGDGTFGALRLFTIPDAAGDTAGLALADLDGDRRNEILFALPAFTSGGGGASRWGLYQLAVDSGAVQAVLPDGAVRWPLVADFNKDGAQDVVGVGDPALGAPGISVYLNGCPP